MKQKISRLVTLKQKISLWTSFPVVMNIATAGFLYLIYTRSMDSLWFKNNLVRLHPEILTPYEKRYKDEECPDYRSIDKEIEEISKDTGRKSIIDILMKNAAINSI